MCLSANLSRFWRYSVTLIVPAHFEIQQLSILSFLCVKQGLRPAKLDESPVSNRFVFSTGSRLSTLPTTHPESSSVIRAARSMLSPAPKQFDRRDHSNTPALVHHSSERAPHRERPRPNGILFSRSSPVLAALIFGLRSARAPLPLDVSDPKIVALGGQESAPKYCGLALSSPSQESAPK